ncbi:putative bifunctional diguanylate cyclase/phosphodiesterase [Rhizobium sp. TRM95796]|uniref:putative bifunctional diguanylate cyclase/phosphodiesterase n=1 Tax=Rhizobium sp. TRM95796 TaxID=2979862 RepID=UPI0021E92839|nr:bifunctional diguanylate cyclase/phosphodiesterase [Rhizobium sp. TRM95796]MCV3764495.1 bifunctional diguanylate cyclase/phosphodiesterase [Rhizobium sp. TRM95796]
MRIWPDKRNGLNHAGMVVVVGLLLVALSATLAALVVQSVTSIFHNADRLDDARAVSAAQGASKALRSRLSATLRDNAFWDDAFEVMKTPDARQWIIDNWASTTEDYPLYDTAIVYDGFNRPVVAYHAGVEIAHAEQFFDLSLSTLLARARDVAINRDHLSVSFIRTRIGVAVVGAAPIQPSVMPPGQSFGRSHVLLFAKHMTPGMIADVRGTFNIRGLTLANAPVKDNLSIGLRNIKGERIAYFVWPSQKPGSASYEKVEHMLATAAGVFVAIVAAIIGVAALLLRDARHREKSLAWQAAHDPLTGLLNRSGLYEAAQKRFEAATRPVLTLHLVDLDGFKAVNDIWGHPVGDQLIREAANRIALTIPSDAAIARLGGDEFAVLSDRRMASDIGASIQQALSAHFDIDGRVIKIGASVGVASSDPNADDIHELLRRADLALYRAKEMGRGVNVDYEAGLDRDARRQRDMEQDLRQGLADGEIDVAFQPLINARTGALGGVEALARWKKPDGSLVRPDLFIPAAERSGLIDQLGLRIAELALRAAAHWGDTGLALNISPIQLKNPFLVANLAEVMQRNRFSPSRLTIEVTEGVLISDPEQAQKTFDALREMGVKIALDDFGCGYASIGALRKFGFDRLKIDRSLVSDLEADENASAVLKATISLANALNVAVTAEGIETETQAAFAKLSGCDELQGYHFSRPVTASEIAARYFPQLRPADRVA